MRGLVTGDVEQLRTAVHLADESSQAVMSVGFRAALVLRLAATSPDETLACAPRGLGAAIASQNPTALASAHLSAGVVQLQDDPSSARSHLEACKVMAADVANRMLAVMADVLENLIPAAPAHFGHYFSLRSTPSSG